MAVLQTIKKIAKGESTIDFVGKRKLWFTISLVLVAASILILATMKLNLGLAFEGGSSFSVPIADGKKAPTVPQVETAMNEAGLPAPQVQLESSADRAHIRVEAETASADVQSKVLDSLASISGQSSTDAVSVQNVGPTWGAQVSNKALRALIVFLIVVVIYIALRFETKIAICTIVSLFHDLIITIGLYALTGFEVTPGTVVAYLTILGYSLYDSVVVFDKVQENSSMLTGTARMSYSDMVNKSVNQTAMRSINTSLSSLLPVGGLLFVGVYLFGAETLKDLALALFLGIGVGSYSSIFLGPPLLAVLKEREPKYRQMAARARAVVPAMATAAPAADGAMSEGEAPAPAARSAYRAQALQAKARKQRGGKRRR